MQDTVGEFRRHGRDESCSTCHAKDRNDHSFAGANDLRMLRKALRVAACQSEDGTRITLANRGAAHNVPSGDVFRVLHFAAQTPQTKYSHRFFRRGRGENGRIVVVDKTLAAGAHHQVTLPGEKAIEVTLAFEYAPRESPVEFLRRTYVRRHLPRCRR